MRLRDEIFRSRRPDSTPEPPTDERLLAFEGKHRGHNPRKEERIRHELAVTPARYYQLLGRLVWTEEALAIDPILTNALRRDAMKAREERARRFGK